MSRVVTEEGRREALLPARLHLRSLSRVNADGWRALRLLALEKGHDPERAGSYCFQRFAQKEWETTVGGKSAVA